MSNPSSLADSQKHILDPPNAPFANTIGSNNGSLTRSAASSALALGLNTASPGSDTNSLSVNYFPSKFGRAPSPSLHKRRNGKNDDDPNSNVPKSGGGREAFRSNEARMPAENDDDYDGVDVHRAGATWTPRLRWNRFKWILFLTNIIVTAYSLVALIFCLLTWFNVWTHADVVRVGNRPELVTSTLATSVSLLTSYSITVDFYLLTRFSFGSPSPLLLFRVTFLTRHALSISKAKLMPNGPALSALTDVLASRTPSAAAGTTLPLLRLLRQLYAMLVQSSLAASRRISNSRDSSSSVGTRLPSALFPSKLVLSSPLFCAAIM